MRGGARLLALLLALPPAALSTPSTTDGQLWVGDFAMGDLKTWQEHSFEGKTSYRLTQIEGEAAIKAESRKSASGLFKRIRVDLEKTPYLYWRWRVENTLDNNDERHKSGDDYPARVYVIREGGMLPWRTRALNYVWSSSQPQGSSWPNAFTDRSWMIALRSGSEELGRMVSERVDVRGDFRRLFREDVRYVDVVALMSDTDNTGSQATAYFGSLYFSGN